MFQLLTKSDGNPKTAKSLSHKVMTFVLHLAPAQLSGHNVCPMMTAGCSYGCLNTAGRAGLSGTALPIAAARIGRTRLYFEQREAFMAALVSDISKAIEYAKKRGFQAVFRLNATSDIPWHRVPVADAANVMALFPHHQFYDYTKVAKRLLHERLPENYQLTFSVSETNAHEAFQVLVERGRIAIILRTKDMVARAVAAGEVPLGRGSVQGLIIDGDADDLRFRDPPAAIVALSAKGRAKLDQTGWVRDFPA